MSELTVQEFLRKVPKMPNKCVVYAAREMASAIMESKGIHLDQGLLIEANEDDAPATLIEKMGPGGKSIKVFVFIDLVKATKPIDQGGAGCVFVKAKPVRNLTFLSCNMDLIESKFCNRVFIRDSTASKTFREIDISST